MVLPQTQSSPQQGSKHELAEQARAGDREALGFLYQQYRQRLIRHAWRMLGQEALALDVVQEAYARALVSIGETRPNLNFGAWIYRIVSNLCLRELSRRDRVELDADLHPVEHRSPGDILARREIGELLQVALQRLPERYRQILLLRELEELSYEELSQVLELSPSAIKVLLHRARGRFFAVYLAERLLEGPAPETMGCPELTQLLEVPERRQLEQHLERCSLCRQLESRPAAELLALLPPLPVACHAGAAPDVEKASSERARSEGELGLETTGRATVARGAELVGNVGNLAAGGGGTLSLGWIFVLGAVVLAGGLAVAGAFWSARTQRALPPSAVVPTRSEAQRSPRGQTPISPEMTRAPSSAPTNNSARTAVDTAGNAAADTIADPENKPRPTPIKVPQGTRSGDEQSKGANRESVQSVVAPAPEARLRRRTASKRLERSRAGQPRRQMREAPDSIPQIVDPETPPRQ